MLSILRKYHDYLKGVAVAASAVTRPWALQAQLVPWISPIFAGAVVCFLLDQRRHLDQPQRLMILIPFGIITLLGAGYVGFVFLLYGAKADISRGNAQRKGGQ